VNYIGRDLSLELGHRLAHAAQRIGLQLHQPALTGPAEAAELNAKRLPDHGTPSWLVSAASPC
jgi:hypothetical protein